MINHEAKTPVGHPESIDMRRPETHPRPPIDRSTGAGHQKKIWREEKRARARAPSRGHKVSSFCCRCSSSIKANRWSAANRSKDTGRDAISKSSRMRSNKKNKRIVWEHFPSRKFVRKKTGKFRNHHPTGMEINTCLSIHKQKNQSGDVSAATRRLAERVTTWPHSQISSSRHLLADRTGAIKVPPGGPASKSNCKKTRHFTTCPRACTANQYDADQPDLFSIHSFRNDKSSVV